MTNPNSPEGIDTSGKIVPPYEGRRKSGDVADPAESTREGVKVGGATGPVEDDARKAVDPDDTVGGASGSPSDEQPASEAPQTDLDDDGVGPAHVAGTPRGEDQA